MNKRPHRSTHTVPENLAGMLVYFQDLADVPVYAALDRKLLLISEDNNSAVSDYPSDMVFGYVMNEPLMKTFKDHFGEAAAKLPGHLRFLQVMNSQVEKYEPVEAGYATFITQRAEPLGTLNECLFGDFVSYTCETEEEAIAMQKYLPQKDKTISVHSLFAIDRERLLPLIKTGNALIREATPEIVFNQSAFMRTINAFPQSAPNFTP